MKKLIALLLALLMVLSLGACAAKEETPAKEEAPATSNEAEAPAEEETEAPAEESDALPYEGVTLTYWFPPYTGEDQSWWEDVFAEFTAQTGAAVEVTIVPWGDMSAKYMTGFMSGEGPDVFYMTNEMMYDMVDAGACLDLSAYYSEEEAAEQLFWSAGNKLGGQYAAPFTAGVGYRGMMFNMDLLEAAGVTEIPTTWDEVIAAGQKIKDAGVCEYPVMYGMGAGNNTAVLNSFLPTLWSAGGDMVNAEGTAAAINSDEALAACQYLYDLIYKYEIMSADCTTIDTTSLTELFNEGKIAIACGEIGYVMDAERKDNFEVYSTLGVTDGSHEVMTFSPVDTMCVNANSKNVEAAVALLKFVTSNSVREHFRTDCYPTLVRMNASGDEIAYSNDSVTACMTQVGEHTRTMPVCKGVNSMVESMITNLQLLMLDELTPAETVEAMETAINTVLNS